MKIVIDARTMGSKPSGIGRYMFNCILELFKLGYEIILLSDVATSYEMKIMKDKNIKIITYGDVIYQSAKVFKYFRFVEKQLRELQPDVFWEPNFLIPSRLNGFKGKVIITIHDIFPVTHKQFFTFKYRLYFSLMMNYTLRKTDIILYDSKESKDEAEKYFKIPKKIKGVVQYIIVPRVEKVSQSGKLRPEVENQKDYFLYVGNLEKRKGVDLVLDAFDKYKENGGNARLVLAGKSREQDIDAKIAAISKKYSDFVSLGYVSDEEKQYLYANCKCFLFPSRAEGFGISILEAMNYYKPVIASDLCIFQEIVGNCINYFELTGNNVNDTASLCKIFTNFASNVDKSVYDEVMDRYTAETLGSKLIEIFDNI